MLRLLFFALLLYFVFTVLRAIVRGASSPEAPSARVRGRQKQNALDLSGADVEDAKFEEIKKKH